VKGNAEKQISHATSISQKKSTRLGAGKREKLKQG
jgi:hypothetical protein